MSPAGVIRQSQGQRSRSQYGQYGCHLKILNSNYSNYMETKCEHFTWYTSTSKHSRFEVRRQTYEQTDKWTDTEQNAPNHLIQGMKKEEILL